MKYILVLLFLVGCALDLKLADSGKDKVFRCVDTRDGDVFYFNTNTVHDAKYVVGGRSYFKIVTFTGDTLTLYEDDDVWLKATEVKDNKHEQEFK